MEGELRLESNEFLVTVISPSLIVETLTTDLRTRVEVLMFLAKLLDLLVFLLGLDVTLFSNSGEDHVVVFDLMFFDHQDTILFRTLLVLPSFFEVALFSSCLLSCSKRAHSASSCNIFCSRLFSRRFSLNSLRRRESLARSCCSCSHVSWSFRSCSCLFRAISSRH